MQVIILNSGIGTRLLPYTQSKPKCLLRIDSKNILEYQIESLIKANLNDIIITTGPFETQIKNFISKRFPQLKVIYVNNPKYASTNYIYSLWLVKEKVHDDILLLHGDLIFDQNLLTMLINEQRGNYVLVNNFISPPEKDFKSRIKDGFVKKISVKLKGENVFFLAPFYRITRNDFLLWLNKIDEYVEKNELNYYAEDVLNELLNDVKLLPLFYKNEICMEIDSEEDLFKARKLLKNIN